MEQEADFEVAVVGAGPYGLSVAAHLAPRVRVCVFGRPMRTWRELMPPDMLLRSDWEHTNLSAPDDLGTIDRWTIETGEVRTEPLPLQMFLRYADWFVRRFVPDVDDSRITELGRFDDRFWLRTDDGRLVRARNVVLALGVTPFPFVPEVLRSLGPEHLSLAAQVQRPGSLDGRRVVVVGGGQNALEAALGAVRAGAASVDVLVRSRVRWFAGREPSEERGRIRTALCRLAYPIVGFGPPPLNRLVLHPELFAKMPEGLRRRLSARLLRSGGSPWLREQLDGRVGFREGASIVRVRPGKHGVSLHLGDGGVIEADHLIVACGYRFDMERIDFLTPELRPRVDRSSAGWPVLTDTLESTCAGLYFVGYPSEGRFGPLVRFVEGTRFAAQRCSASFAA